MKPKKGSFQYTFIYFISQNLIFLLFVTFLFLARSHASILNYTFASLLLTIVISESIKYVHFKARPTKYLFGVTHDSSFPSTHTAVSFALALTYAFSSVNIFGILLLLSLAVLVGLGRVLSGAHFTVDVLAGAVLAFFVSMIVTMYQIGFVFGLNV